MGIGNKAIKRKIKRMITRYRLLKDTPNAKAGALFLKENNSHYYHKTPKGDITSSYQHRDVEENPVWFEKVDVDIENGVYYIPTIEEFHLGFEYEILLHLEENKWGSLECYGGDLLKIENHIDKGRIRVKCIDKDDCLLLELDLKVWNNGGGYFSKGDYTIGIYGSNRFCTISQNDCGNNIVRFSGDLKNKSELRRILKQVGCI